MTYQDSSPKPSKCRIWSLFLCGGLALVLAVGLGVVIGLFAISRPGESDSRYKDLMRGADERISDLFMKEVNANNIEKALQHLVSNVHRAGTPGGNAVAHFIHDSFIDYGLDKVEYEEYDVMLSYPNDTNPDQIAIVNTETNRVLVNISNGHSKMLVEKEESVSPNADVRFNAFAKMGQVTTAKLVYANYGTQDDFDYLTKTANINLTGAIVMARYRKLWRGAKVQLAEKLGAAGVLLFSDPKDETYGQRTDPESTYPNTVNLPPTAVQRGLTSYFDAGDILTPLLPSKEYVIRHNIEEMYSNNIIPKIPVTPISYSDAQKLLEAMGGPVAPSEWQGGLSVPYRLGSEMRPNQSVSLTVTTYPEQRKVRNVIGYIRGRVEPDRYVIVGNHHDAWVYGAVDPSSGTAVMLEMAHALASVVKKTGWRPRRTIVFCAWDAEEYGMIGSSEFVEQYLRRLEAKAIAYLNVDSGLTGNETVWAKSVPLLKHVLVSAAAKVENPNPAEVQQGRKTVLDTWVDKKPDKQNPKEPMLDSIGSGSDYRHFLDYAGIPSLDFRYAQAADRNYPLYHTLHETMHLVRLMDHSFVYLQAVARMWGEMTRELADSVFIPFNVTDYGHALTRYIDELAESVSESPASSYANITHIVQAGDVFLKATAAFDSNLSALAKSGDYDLMRVRIINDQLMHLERMFILPFGLAGRHHLRHVIFAPSISDAYSGVNFAGIMDKLQEIAQANAPAERETSVDKLAIILNDQISWVAHCIYSAADLLMRDL